MKYYFCVVEDKQGELKKVNISAVNMQAARVILVGDGYIVYSIKELDIKINLELLQRVLNESKQFTGPEVGLITAAVHKAQNPFTRNRKPKQA